MTKLGARLESAVGATDKCVDLMAPCLTVLDTTFRDVQDLLGGRHRCAAQNSCYKVR